MIDKNTEMMQKILNATETEGLVAANFFMELELITDNNIRRFVKEVFLKHVPAYYWKIPASASGKYHNADECVDCGLVKHTKRVVKMAIQLMKGLGWFGHNSEKIKPEYERYYNIVIAAALLHDTFKGGFEGREKKIEEGKIGTDGMHPYYVREALRMKKLGESYMNSLPFFDDIMKAIEGHSGFWSVIPGTENLKDSQSPVFIVYMADYIASRKIEDWFKV